MYKIFVCVQVSYLRIGSCFCTFSYLRRRFVFPSQMQDLEVFGGPLVKHQ